MQFDTPVVLPLLSGESPPEDLPNYFDTRELGTTSLVIFSGCIETLDQAAAPDASDERLGAMCTCMADAARQNTRVAQAPIPTDAQFSRCLAFAAGSMTAASPFSPGLPCKTIHIADLFAACFDGLPEGAPIKYAGTRCSCSADAALKDASSPAVLAADLGRCETAARYANNTGQNLTRRQFDGLRRAGGSTIPPTGEWLAPVPQAPAIPYISFPGNGLGPSVCADGMWSHSSGRGTCSGHGGEIGSRRHHGR